MPYNYMYSSKILGIGGANLASASSSIRFEVRATKVHLLIALCLQAVPTILVSNHVHKVLLKNFLFILCIFLRFYAYSNVIWVMPAEVAYHHMHTL